MNLGILLASALAASLVFTTTGCLHRRPVVVVREAYPTPVMEQPSPQSPASVAVSEAPPPPKVETPPPAPSTSHVWVEGYWVWERGWVWRPGVWVARPRPGVVWVPGHWHRAPRGWIWTPGHWR